MMRRTPDLDDLDREIRDHIELETQDNIARGMSDEDARAAAIKRFGNVTRVKEDVREVWIPGWFDRLRQDARDAIRNVRRNPAFSFAVVVTLALGIGLTTAIYSVVNAVLIRPLNYEHPQRMVWLTTKARDPLTRQVRSEGAREIMNSIDFGRWKAQVTSLAHMIAYTYTDATVAVGGDASRLRIVAASDGFWEVSGARPILGTLPTAQQTDVIALTHRVFREQFNSDGSIVGKAIAIDGRPATIGAILNEDFQPQLLSFSFLQVDLHRTEPGAYRLMALAPPPTLIGPATQVAIYQAFGEIKEGVTIEQARAEIESVHDREQREHPSPFGDSAALVVPLRDKIVGPSRAALAILLSAAMVVLLITCANVANLLLSRASERRKEIALRMSVGGGPIRVVRQLLAESLGYAMLGGTGGLLIASWLINVVLSVIGDAVPRLMETRLDVGVMAVAAGLSMITALLFGVGPALALAFTNVQEVLKDGGRSVSASRRVLFAGRAMAGAQIALTIVLLAGAGLMFKSVWRMTTYPAEFKPEQLLTMRMDFRGPGYRDIGARHAAANALLERAKALPGVHEAAITTGSDSLMLVIKEGEPVPLPPEQRAARQAPVTSVSGDFGRMLGMSLVSGRWFSDAEAPHAVIVNESLARRDFPGEDAVGRRIVIPYNGGKNLGTIVGVVRDLKYRTLDAEPGPEVFLNQADSPIFGVTFVMRTDDPLAAAPGIRKALSQVDPTQTFYSVRTMEQGLSELIAPRRFNLLLLAIFASVALVLAVLGVYGVVAYGVAERTQEIGIRLALGAERAGVVRMIIAQGMRSVMVGLASGVVVAWVASRSIDELLYGVQPHDVPTFAWVAVSLAAVAFIACAVPALRAAWVQPAVALRAE